MESASEEKRGLMLRASMVYLQMAVSFAAYFGELMSMVERLSRSLALYQEYEPMLGDYPRFEEALVATYHPALVFICKARAVFSRSGRLHPT